MLVVTGTDLGMMTAMTQVPSRSFSGKKLHGMCFFLIFAPE